MRISKYLWLVGLLLLVSLIAFGTRPVSAQQLAPATINDFQITTLDDKPVSDSTLMAGATYKVDFTIAVAAGNPVSGFGPFLDSERGLSWNRLRLLAAW
jgi:hypothetical protein